MINEAMAAEIIRIVKENNGLKPSAIKSYCSKEFGTPSMEVDKILQELVSQKKLVEIEFTFDMSMIHSFLVPARTHINIRGQEPEPPRRI